MGTGCSKNGEKLPFSFIGLLPIGGVGRKSPTMVIFASLPR